MAPPPTPPRPGPRPGPGPATPPRRATAPRRDQRPAPPRPAPGHDPAARFHNPYSWVPAVDRAEGGEFGDRAPHWHDRLGNGLWSGRIGVELTTVTPLLLPEVESEDTDTGHRTYRTRTSVDADGVERVHVDGSAVRGMLRSWYEAVTNSRLAVFRQTGRLGFRADESYPRKLVPAAVIAQNGSVILFPGLRACGNRNAMGAVRVPRYEEVDTSLSPSGWRETADWKRWDIAHGDRVEAWVAFHGSVNGPRRGIGSWHAIAARRFGVPGDFPAPPSSWPLVVRVSGFLHAVNKGSAPKVHERLFVHQLLDALGEDVELDPPRPVEPHEMADDAWETFRQLVTHYREQHRSARRDEIWERGTGARPVRPWTYLADEPGKTAWSRHLYDVQGLTPERRDALRLTAEEIAAQGAEVLTERGRVTCFAEWDGRYLHRLVPVQITRILHEKTPYELLPRDTGPATELAGLSPADRVFGWVSQGDPAAPRTEDDYGGDAEDGRDRAWASAVRIGPVLGPAVADGPIQRVQVPLEILSAPKPSQGRFYIGDAGPAGRGVPGPLPPGTPKESFFSGTRRIRGRKVYPHDRRRANDPAYWQPGGDRAGQEYRRLGGIRDDQNRTMTDWVRAGQRFGFTLDVRNLSDLELGALLWLLDPGRLGADAHDGHLKLGAGKPFGFGSVRVRIVEQATDLRRGAGWARDIATFGAPAAADDFSGLAAAFEDALNATRHGPALRRAVQRAAAGYDDEKTPIHYPRAEQTRDPEGENFKWFVANEQRARQKPPRDTSLPLLGPGEPPTLPYQQPEERKPPGGR